MKNELITDKVRLRRVEKADAKDLYPLRSHPIVNRFIKRDIPKSMADVERFIEKINAGPDPYYYTIWTVPDAEFAGTICLWNINWEAKYAEVGYELLPNFQGRGIMSAALGEILNFGFRELKLQIIEAFTHRENYASLKLLEKFNFQRIPNKTDPGNADNVIFSLQAP